MQASFDNGDFLDDPYEREAYLGALWQIERQTLKQFDDVRPQQEREVAFEVEAVHEVKKPINYSQLSFAGLYRDVLSFVKTSRLVAGSAGYEQAFVALRRTALGVKYGISSNTTGSHLYRRSLQKPLLCHEGNLKTSHD